MNAADSSTENTTDNTSVNAADISVANATDSSVANASNSAGKPLPMYVINGFFQEGMILGKKYAMSGSILGFITII